MSTHDDDRVRRVPAERTGPVRSASTAFRPPEEGPGPGQPSGMPPYGPYRPMEEGVSNAYGVLDEYFRRGYQAADFYNRAPPPSYPQAPGYPQAPPYPYGPSGGMVPLNGDARDWAVEAMRLWGQLLWPWFNLFLPRWLSPQGNAQPGPFGPPPPPWAPGISPFYPPPAPPPGYGPLPTDPAPTESLAAGLHVCVSVRATTGQPVDVEVTAALYPGAEIPKLALSELRSTNPHKTGILQNVKLERVGVNSIQCRILVEEPTIGEYEGTIYQPDDFRPMVYRPTLSRRSGFVRVNIKPAQKSQAGSKREEVKSES